MTLGFARITEDCKRQLIENINDILDFETHEYLTGYNKLIEIINPIINKFRVDYTLDI